MICSACFFSSDCIANGCRGASSVGRAAFARVLWGTREVPEEFLKSLEFGPFSGCRRQWLTDGRSTVDRNLFAKGYIAFSWTFIECVLARSSNEAMAA
jgi:hypothetical protein